MRVYKYRLPERGVQELDLPRGSVPLTVHVQDGGVRMWVEIPDVDAPKENRVFFIALTGFAIQITPPWKYIGTCFLDGGDFVVHVYEVLRG